MVCGYLDATRFCSALECTFGDYGVSCTERYLMITLNVSAGMIAEDCTTCIFVSKAFFSSTCCKSTTHGRFVLVNRNPSARFEIFDLRKCLLMDSSGRYVSRATFCSRNLAGGTKRRLGCFGGRILWNQTWIDSHRFSIFIINGARMHELL